jgi:hypothetical protein
MKHPHRHHHGNEDDAETVAELAEADYDTQADLALPSRDAGGGEAFAPFAGTLVPDEPRAGYDIERDVGT